MASVSGYSLLLPSLVVFLLIHPTLSDQDLINKICRQMEDYGFCYKTFKANQKAPSMDIAGLTQLTINLAKNNASDTHAYTLPYLKNATTPEVIKVLTECVKDYQFVMDAFDQALKFFNQKDYNDMLLQEFPTPKTIASCESGFSFKPNPVNSFFFLIDRTRNLRILVTMAIVTGHYLLP